MSGSSRRNDPYGDAQTAALQAQQAAAAETARRLGLYNDSQTTATNNAISTPGRNETILTQHVNTILGGQ